MKRFLGKVIISVTGVLAVLGLTSIDAKPTIKHDPSIQKISETTPLYLIPAKEISQSAANMTAWHTSHQSHWSHSSHQSHESHQSHYSHYSSW